MVMKKSDIQDEIMNKIQKKIDKDIERMKSKKDMDKSVEKQIRKQLLDLYLFQHENEVKLEKQRKTKVRRGISENIEKNAKPNINITIITITRKIYLDVLNAFFT